MVDPPRCPINFSKLGKFLLHMFAATAIVNGLGIIFFVGYVNPWLVAKYTFCCSKLSKYEMCLWNWNVHNRVCKYVKEVQQNEGYNCCSCIYV